MKKTSYFRNSQSYSNFGFYTIVIAFVMLCVLVFLALPLATAGADYRQNQNYAEKKSSYYKAEEMAYDHLVLIDRLLTSSYMGAENKQDYFRLAHSQLESLDFGTVETDNSGCTFFWEESISDYGTLKIELQIQYPQNDTDGFYSIVKWQSVYNTLE